MENFTLISQHFKKFLKTLGLTWAREILVPSAGAASVPHLFDETIAAIEKAGAELAHGEISNELMQTISDVPISKNDYIDMVNASFKGGITGRAKAIAIGIKALRSKGKNKQSNISK